uniref:Uncharacterized protein n=1 Tax=Ditylenchus dipsaci TaxID=166011 RepID=A0A915EPQ7_9BILA
MLGNSGLLSALNSITDLSSSNDFALRNAKALLDEAADLLSEGLGLDLVGIVILIGGAFLHTLLLLDFLLGEMRINRAIQA